LLRGDFNEPEAFIPSAIAIGNNPRRFNLTRLLKHLQQVFIRRRKRKVSNEKSFPMFSFADVAKVKSLFPLCLRCPFTRNWARNVNDQARPGRIRHDQKQQTLRQGAETVLADRLDLCFLLFDAGFQCADQSSQALDAIFEMLLLPERKDGWPPDPRKFRNAVYWHVHCEIDHNWNLLLRPEMISECDQSCASLGRLSRSDKPEAPRPLKAGVAPQGLYQEVHQYLQQPWT
jgi:hypothetical protein